MICWPSDQAGAAVLPMVMMMALHAGEEDEAQYLDL
jgi:hypothetical protein